MTTLAFECVATCSDTLVTLFVGYDAQCGVSPIVKEGGFVFGTARGFCSAISDIAKAKTSTGPMSPTFPKRVLCSTINCD